MAEPGPSASRLWSFGATLCGLAWLGAMPLPAQVPASALEHAILRLSAMTAVTGYEQAMVDTLLTLIPGSVRDRAGNAVLAIGQRGRLLVCPISEPGYVVGNIRPDGYLTLRRAPGVVPPGLERQLEGQQVTLHGQRGPVPGVVGVRSIHLTRGRTTPTGSSFTLDSAYVDVGASARPDVLALGLDVLAPLTLTKGPHRYGEGLLAAPSAGRRAACAALLQTARRVVAEPGMVPSSGGLTLAFVVEQELAAKGLATLAHTRGPFRETVLVDGGAVADTAGPRQARDLQNRWPGLGTVSRWPVPSRYPGSPVETVSLSDVQRLEGELTDWIRRPQ